MMEVRGRVLPPPRLQYKGRGATMSGQVSRFNPNRTNITKPFRILIMNDRLALIIAHVSSAEQS